jgi:protein tyrosine phosphatase
MVLDTMLERMKEEDTLNVYDYVKQLREQRVLMVQTLVRPSVCITRSKL